MGGCAAYVAKAAHLSQIQDNEIKYITRKRLELTVFTWLILRALTN